MRFLSFLAAAFCASYVSASPTRAGSALARRKVAVPHSFKWSSTGPLVGPKDDGHGIAAIKEPSVVQVDGTYHVFATTIKPDGSANLVYLNYTDFSNANSAPFFYLEQSAIGKGYRAAPQVFYFAPQKLWYLIFQNGNAAYSTNPDISNPAGWSAPKTFFSSTPTLVQTNTKSGGYWVHMWVICDKDNCHLFSSDDNGRLYRSQTSLVNFPSGMSEPVVALENTQNKYALYEGACVYAIRDGACPDKFLLLVEAFGSDGQRYFRSWTSKKLDGTWKPLADTEGNPFARSTNSVPAGGATALWTKQISHGEVVRSLTDQTLPIDVCKLSFLHQGMAPATPGSTPFNSLPWKLGMLTLTNPNC